MSIETSSSLLSQREVASGMVNLGNTCYMNAVLQALAHAPDLCMAIDGEPHQLSCPTAKRNSEALKANAEMCEEKDNSESVAIKEDKEEEIKEDVESPPPQKKKPQAKKSRTGKKKSASPLPPPSSKSSPPLEFCALCEFEKHMERVHTSGNTKSSSNPTSSLSSQNGTDPVAPSDLVNGFISKVAPQFQLGVQEDSHEFLRLLIEAMQKSCADALPCTSTTPGSGNDEGEEKEYPYKLFRGTVESKITCSSCQNQSSKLDPVEDIGLEVVRTSDTKSGFLTDIHSALSEYTKEESLDDSYKCEHCECTGTASRRCKLASIPPILTLHLKRFRYGVSSDATATGGGRRSSHLSDNFGGFSSMFGGTSGSAKIEGHIHFDQIFDLRPFLTESLREVHKKMFCRLFAVVVHTGKNSHSGHYVAYVRNLAKNEWWKMDDARCCMVGKNEVLGCDAYMLFYKVVDHPVGGRLKELRDGRLKEWQMLQEERNKIQQQDHERIIKQNEKEAAAAQAEASDALAAAAALQEHTLIKKEEGEHSTCQPPSSSSTYRKRKHTSTTPLNFFNGESWAKKSLTNSQHYLPSIYSIQDFLSESTVQFKSEYFHYLNTQVMSSKIDGKFGCDGPTADLVPTTDDIQAELAKKMKSAITDALYEWFKEVKNCDDLFITASPKNAMDIAAEEKSTEEDQEVGNGATGPERIEPLPQSISSHPMIIPVVEVNETVV